MLDLIGQTGVGQYNCNVLYCLILYISYFYNLQEFKIVSLKATSKFRNYAIASLHSDRLHVTRRRLPQEIFAFTRYSRKIARYSGQLSITKIQFLETLS